jgi:hypothetical protein
MSLSLSFGLETIERPQTQNRLFTEDRQTVIFNSIGHLNDELLANQDQRAKTMGKSTNNVTVRETGKNRKDY